MIICKYYVYLLKSTTSNRTYIGYTIDVNKRLKKHNGELSGGAKKTRKGRPWEIVLFVTGFEFERTALQFEFCIQKPPKRFRKKGPGIKNKMIIMKSLLYKKEKICSTSPLNSELNLAIFFLNNKSYEIWNSV